MLPLRLRLSPVVLAVLVTGACGGSDRQRKVPPGDGGPDGAGLATGSGGRASGGAASGGSGTGGGTAGAGGVPGAGGAAQPDAGDAAPPLDGAAEVGVAPDSGPVIGEFCVFPDTLLEDEVRSAIDGLGLDGGVPSGPIPVALAARLTSMESFCDCSDARDLTGIECLTGLQSLTLRDTYSSVAPLRWLPNLTTLTFQYQSSLPSGMGVLSQLRTLDLSGNYLSDLRGIEGLTGLTELNAGGNTVTDVTAIAGLIGLENLSLYNNRVTSIAPLAGLTNLETLDVGNNAITDLAAVEGLTRLAFLNVTSSAPITDFSPLVRNAGIGAGDEIYAAPLLEDCASFDDDIAALAARGATLNGFPACP